MDNDSRIDEIWIELKIGEKDFKLDIIPGTKTRRLKVKGDTYHFENILSYVNYGQNIVRIKLIKAIKVES